MIQTCRHVPARFQNKSSVFFQNKSTVYSLFLLVLSLDSSFWVDSRSPLFTACSRSCSFPMSATLNQLYLNPACPPPPQSLMLGAGDMDPPQVSLHFLPLTLSWQPGNTHRSRVWWDFLWAAETEKLLCCLISCSDFSSFRLYLGEMLFPVGGVEAGGAPGGGGGGGGDVVQTERNEKTRSVYSIRGAETTAALLSAAEWDDLSCSHSSISHQL